MHTYVRLRGFGLTVVSFAPHIVRRVGDGADSRIAIEHDGRVAILDPAHGAIADEVLSVADVGACEYAGDWLMDFGDFTVRWPNRWALGSSGLDGVPFEWWGRDGAAVMWQGPFSRVPSDEELAAPGRTLANADTADGVRWAEFHYDVDGVAWAQRHTILPGGYVITAQRPREASAATWPTADALARDARRATGRGFPTCRAFPGSLLRFAWGRNPRHLTLFLRGARLQGDRGLTTRD